ncbi:MAG TPA: hypothetical protein VIV40_20055 [Kofleriaceae bacterium]
MGAPSDDDPDRKVTHIDRTAASHDRTTIDPRASGPAVTEDSTISALDRTMAMLERDAEVDNDRTTAGLGVATTNRSGAPRAIGSAGRVTPAPRGLVLLEPGKGTVPLEKQQVLVQPERSPLDLVMRDMDPAAPTRAHAAGDSSRFVASFISDQPAPPRVDEETPVITAMQPVLRRARQRRRWIAAGALATTAVLGAVLAFTLTATDEAPRTAANEAAKVTEAPVTDTASPPTPPPQVATASAAPTANTGLTAEPSPSPAAPTELATVAVAKTAEPTVDPATAPSTSTKLVTARPAVTKDETKKKSSTDKKLATAQKSSTETKSSTAKKSSSAKSSIAKSSTTKSSGAKTSTAKPAIAKASTTKSSPAKSSTTKASIAKSSSDKSSTAKASAKKSATATKSSAATKSSTAKKPSTTTKSTTTKKPSTTTAKKTSTKKSSRSQRSSRRTRRR